MGTTDPSTHHVYFYNPPPTALVAYCNLLLLACFGYFRDFLRMWGIEKSVNSKEFENEVRVSRFLGGEGVKLAGF